MAVDTSRIVHLARQIIDSVSKIDQSLADKNLARPTFEESCPRIRVPLELADLRDIVLDASEELHDLFLEPLFLVKKYASINTSICLQAISRYDLANKVPFGGKISFAELGKQSVLGEKMTVRLIRHAMTMRIFQETEPGFVFHTQASRLLADPDARAWIQLGTEEMWTPCTKMLDSLEKWPGSQEANETAFSYANNTSQSFYEVLSSNPKKRELMPSSMTVFTTRDDFSASHILNAFDWESFIAESQKRGHINDKGYIEIVDVGGSHGEIGLTLVHKFPSLKVTVQDLPEVVASAPDLSGDIAAGGRIDFVAHNFFNSQNITASAFILRWIMHNWSDKYCAQIIRAQIPGLRSGSRFLVMEACLPDPGQTSVTDTVPLWLEREMRYEDLTMGVAFNARERTVREWQQIFANADPRFKLAGVKRPKGSYMSMLEMVWTG